MAGKMNLRQQINRPPLLLLVTHIPDITSLSLDASPPQLINVVHLASLTDHDLSQSLEQETMSERSVAASIIRAHEVLNARLHNQVQNLHESYFTAGFELATVYHELRATEAALQDQILQGESTQKELVAVQDALRKHKEQDPLGARQADSHLRKAYEELQATLKENESKLARAVLEIRQLVAHIRTHEKDEKLQSLQSELTRTHGNVTRLEAENEKIHEKYRELESVQSELTQADHTFEQREVEDKTRVHEKDKELESLRSTLALADGNIKRLEAERETGTHEKDEELKSLRSTLAVAHENIKGLEAEKETVTESLSELEKQRQSDLKTAYNAIQEVKELKEQLQVSNYQKSVYLEGYLSLRGAIRVMCRIRGAEDPSQQRQPADGVAIDVAHDDMGASLSVRRQQKSSLSSAGVDTAPRETSKSWRLDQIFPSTADNNAIWEEVRPLLESAIDGAQVVIILFGRSGSGKSWTSQGIWTHLGDFLFDGVEPKEPIEDALEPDSGEEGQVRLWSVEIYIDKLFDLMQAAKKGSNKPTLPLPRSKGILDPVSQCQASRVTLKSRTGLERALKQVAQMRRSASTNANDRSSRSHSFTCLEMPRGGSITLVDLAGHEKSEGGGKRDEVIAINSSLAALVTALSQLMVTLRGAPRRAQGKTVKKAPSPAKASTTAVKTSPERAGAAQSIRSVWSSGDLLPRIVGGLMLRGSAADKDEEPELKSKVLFMATLDFATPESAAASEYTLDALPKPE